MLRVGAPVPGLLRQGSSAGASPAGAPPRQSARAGPGVQQMWAPPAPGPLADRRQGGPGDLAPGKVAAGSGEGAARSAKVAAGSGEGAAGFGPRRRPRFGGLG